MKDSRYPLRWLLSDQLGEKFEIGAKAPEINTAGTQRRGRPDAQQESEYQWERSVAGTLAQRRESTNKREEQDNLKTKTGHAGSSRIGSITGNIHVTGSMHSLTPVCVFLSRAQLFHNECPGCEVLFLG